MATIQQIEALFHEALSLPAGEDRIQWLDRRCQSDRKLFTDVCLLLKSHEEMAGQEIEEETAPEPSLPSGQFGAYQPVKLIGRGGMSAVYLAERTDGQFRHTAALKVMGAHLAGPEFLRRFRTERQLLATLHHANITSLLDGGVSSTGDPYLVMEYVDGKHLDQYCDSRKLSIESGCVCSCKSATRWRTRTGC